MPALLKRLAPTWTPYQTRSDRLDAKRHHVGVRGQRADLRRLSRGCPQTQTTWADMHDPNWQTYASRRSSLGAN
ncbi:hypothetical protein [Kribbella turkmenica]|uniref:hypothetical protein n=1 Tax=Kribbella turkmenica TaxID=2530375 RepID=UPI001404FA20|nr:hypothetical protein [Kribbella turkmenica]